ncbi:MAG: uracil-DNA glycosylase family protein [Terracidiphilus sp.]
MLDKARQNSGEATDTCWVRLMDFLREAGLDPQNCFFTNALMGIKAGSAAGDMPHDPDYRKECEQYLIKQIEIVHPSRIVSLGNASRLLCGKVYKQSGLKTEMINIMHPSARPVNWGGAYEEWVRKQAERIGESILITPPPKPA